MAKQLKSLEPLCKDIREVLDVARKGAYRAVNFAMLTLAALRRNTFVPTEVLVLR